MTETSFESLVKEIGDAIKLDNDGSDEEAYKKYVVCIHKIATNLLLALNYSGGNVVTNRKTVRQVKLVSQCVDRVSVLIDKMDQSKPKLTATKSNSVEKIFQSPLSEQKTSNAAINILVPSLPTENNPYIFRVQKEKNLSPMEVALRQNQSLMTAYKARMKRLNRSDFNAFNYSLTIQRKLAENIAIAHAQEEELARKMQARNQRLEEEAAKRFATPIGMSKEEQEQRQIYKRILEYENEAKWLKNWRNKLESNPEDPILISQLVAEVLRCADHPLTELLQKYQQKIYERLYPLVHNKHYELDQIKIPLARNVWPTLKEVSDIVFIQESSPQSPTVEGDRGLNNNDSVDSSTKLAAEQRDKLNNTPENSLDNSWDDPLCVKSESNQSVKSILKENIDKGVEDNDLTSLSASVSSIDSYNVPVSSIGKGVKEESDAHQSCLEKSVSETKKNLELALNRNQDLISQLSWERKQAQLLMRQVTRDYSSYKMDNYDEDNLDYLFDEESESEDGGFLSQKFWETFTVQSNGNLSLANSGISGGVGLARSVSHQPTSSLPSVDNSGHAYHSLPANMDDTDGKGDKMYSKMYLEAYKRHLKSISEDIHKYLEKILVMMIIAYEPLDTPVGRDQCAVSLEEPFFKPIWKTLLRLFRVVSYKQELVLASIMTRHTNIMPEDLKVSKKLYLTEPNSSSLPYQAAITELSHVQEYYTMLTKLECIVKVCHLICECVDNYYKKQQEGAEVKKKAPSVGADDLVPILSYVIVRSGLPQLAAECQAMSEFIHEGYMIGEEGYCLTTLKTALNFVTSLYPSCLSL